jgi:hypothetical protein
MLMEQYSRRTVDWAIADRKTTDPTIATLEITLRQRLVSEAY